MIRHPKANPDARCCWVCGKLGGQGFTTALRNLGYEMKRGLDGRNGEMGYAHPKCIRKAQREAHNGS